MRKSTRRNLTLWCFSPAVMLGTFVTEIVLALYVLVKYKRSRFSVLAAMMLITLAVFQWAEYQVCGERNPLLWSRIGFAAVTLLPAFGLHLTAFITGNRKLVSFNYVVAILFIGVFLFVPSSQFAPVCTGNYIIFSFAPGLSWTYGMYYTGFLLFAIAQMTIGIHASRTAGMQGKARLLSGMLMSYLVFMIPTAIVFVLYGPVRQSIASILCGFAIFTALIITFWVMPAWEAEQDTKSRG